jgi:PAS domain S-box-containing protein
MAVGGLAGDGRVYLLTVPILALLLIDLRAGMVTTVISLLTYAAFTITAHLGWMANWLLFQDNTLDLGLWVLGGVVFGMCLLVLVTLQWRSGQLLERIALDKAELLQEVQASAERYRLLFDSAPDGVTIVDPDGVISECNQGATLLYGRTREEMIGRPVTSLITESSQAVFCAKLAQLRRLEPAEGEIQVIREDGTLVDIWRKGIPLTDEAGDFAGALCYDRDITQRKQAEAQRDVTLAELQGARDELEQRVQERTAELAESEERYRDLFENANDLIQSVAPDGSILYANRAWRETLGYSEEETAHLRFLDVVHPDSRAHCEAVFRRLMAGEAIGHLEAVFVARDGTPVVVEGSASCRWVSGAPVATRNILRDITERRRAEEERERLLAAEREQRVLAETLREVTLALTSQTSHAAVLDEILVQAQRIVPHSTANIALLEGDLLHVVRWRGYDLFGGEDMISTLVQPLTEFKVDLRVIQSRFPLVIADTRQDPDWLRIEGTEWIRSYLSVPISIGDRVLGLLRLDGATPGTFSLEDAQRLQPLANAAAIAIENARLVERLEDEVAARTAEIQAEREKSETILRSVGDGILMADLDARVQYVNEAFTAMTGYPAEEVLGNYPEVLLEGDMPERDREALQSARAEGRTWRGEMTVRRRDGRTYEAAVTISPLRDAWGNLAGVVSSHQDISQAKMLERARYEFMRSISHEFRTPVTSVKLAADLLLRGLPPEKAQRYYRSLKEQAERMQHLIGDIVEMAALDSGQAVRVWEPITFSSIMDAIRDRFQSRAEAAGLSLVLDALPDHLLTVKGDQVRFTQALAEVVDNAVIFTSQEPAPAGGEVRVSVRVLEERGRPWVAVTVKDTGPGISPEEQEHLFERFYRGSLADSGHVPGTGLGLSIAHEILRAHGGRLTVTSRGVAGEGSTFTLWLPA